MKHCAALLLAGALASCGGGDTTLATGDSGDTTAPSVAITSPASGNSVSGVISLTATAADNVGVVGIQFQFDGGNVNAEDTSEPYAADWDTKTAANGSHVLTAIARDAAGNLTTSLPVTVSVSNPLQPPGAGPRFEETDASVKFSTGWSQANSGWFAWSGSTALETVTPGARAIFSFTGTSVTWIGYRDGSSGIARVYVDGVFVSDVDLFAHTFEVHTPALTVNGLSAGGHTLTIEATGLKNAQSVSNVVVVDAFDVPAPVVSHLQETDPDVVFTAGWAQADGNIAWSGGGAATVPDPPVGGARVSATAGARATLTFRGTSVSWSGARRPGAGIARVFLDGILTAEVDTYWPTNRIQDVVFTATGLADSSHTLAIEATGRRNGASTGAEIVVDAFDVTTPGRRFEEEDAAVTYSGEWIHGNRNRPWSEATISESSVAGAKVTFTFTGTSVSWIGCRKLSTGIAKVYLDNVFVKEINTYEPPPIEAYQTTIFRADALASGKHALTIEVAGNGYVVVDAFDVRP